MKSRLSKIVIFVFLVANLGMAEYIKKDNAVYYKDEIWQSDEKKVNDADFKTLLRSWIRFMEKIVKMFFMRIEN